MAAEDTLGERVQRAIADVLSEEGAMLTGFVLSVDYIDDEGDRGWRYAQADDQSVTATLGMLRWYTLHVEDVCIRSMRDDD
jgi:hypothetical protein